MVNSIRKHAFGGCTNLTSVTIPLSVDTIEIGAFINCRGLSSVSIPSSVNSIGEYAFAYCNGLTSIYTNSSYPLKLNSSPSVFSEVDKANCILHVPYGSKTAYQIANQWKDFVNIMEMPGIKLSATTVNLKAQRGSTTSVNLTSNTSWAVSSDQPWITIYPTSGSGDQKITFTAEENTTDAVRKATVTVSATGVESQTILVTQATSHITKNVAAGGLKTSLTAEELATITKLTISGTIDARDFKTMREDMPLLAEIDLSGVTIAEYTGTEGTIGTNNITYPANAVPDIAFANSLQGKLSLKAILLPSSVNAIGYLSFSGCSNLSSINIPSPVTFIGMYAFYGCTSLNSVRIPSLVNFIGGYAFWSVAGPFSVVEGNSYFSSMDGVLFNKARSILIQCPTSKTGIYEIPSTVTSIQGGAFFGCKGLNFIAIPTSVTSIGGYAFYGCSGLNSASIPSSVTSIGWNAFDGCAGLTSVKIPSSVSYLGGNSFSGCIGLTSIYTTANIPIGLNSSPEVFLNVDKTTCKLYVPYGTKNLYATADQWKDFSSIIEETNGFMVDASLLMLSGEEGSNASANIKANIGWTASSDQSWLSINQSAGNSDQTLVFTAKSNNSVGTRTAKVTVSSAGSPSQIITVIQDGTIPAVTIPIADFPLSSNGVDITGNNDAMTLTNTPFQKGGIYCNGVYDLSRLPNSCKALTPSIRNFNFNSFSVSVDFLVEEYMTQPVLVLGSCRWLGFYLKADSTVDLYYNNFRHLSSTKKYTKNEWHNAKILYDGVTAKIFLDDDLACFINTQLDNPCGDYSNEIGPTNYGNGSVLKGYIKNLKVYNCFAPELKLSANSVNIGAKQGSIATVKITSNTAWSVSSDQSWLTTSSPSGNNDQILSFTADENTTDEARTANVTVSGAGFDPQTISILQPKSIATLNVSAGGLKVSLPAEELATITKLTITGTIDARDFKTMRDDMPNLTELDLSGATIAEYTGTEGTYWEQGSIITYPANEIPIFAFQNEESVNNTLVSVILPLNATSIGWDAFCLVTKLTSIVIPPTITNIGVAAFAGCPFSTVTIPSSVTQIDVVAFSGSGYINVETGNPNYCSIDGVLFNKDKTTIMQVPYSKTGTYAILQSVTRIDDHAFEYCRDLTSIDIPSSITSISHFAFLACTSLSSISIPPKVTFLGDWAFSDCTGLTSIYSRTLVPVDLSHSKEVFLNVDKTNCTLYVPYGTKKLYAAANLWKDFVNILEMPGFMLSETTANLAAKQGSSASVNITSNLNWTANSDQSWLKINPASGAGVKTLTFTAEANPSVLARTAIVTVSATGADSQTILVTQEASSAAVTAGSLKTILSAEELSSVTKLTLTGSIDARDFQTMRDDMPNLTEIDLSVATILSYTGTEGTLISSDITYPANEVPQFAFYNLNTQLGKNSLSRISLPKSAGSIGYYAFQGCTGLETFTIPISVSAILDGAFFGFSGTFQVDAGNNSFSCSDGVLFNKSKSSIIQCTSSKTGNYEIASSVTSIGNGAFLFCGGISTLNIPSSVSAIGSWAFQQCNGLTSIKVNSITPIDLNSSLDVFYGVDQTTCTLKVPYGTKKLYSEANQWKDFTQIVEMPGFLLSGSEVMVPAYQGSSVTLNIISDIKWTASSDQSWLTVNPGSGTGIQTLIFTAEGNPVIAIRTAIVTISADGIEPQTITVTQEKWPTGMDDLSENSTQIKCYPNPFTYEISIEIQNPKRAEISVDIYNLAGERIKNLANKRNDEKLDLKWNGTNDSGQKVVPGVYICKVNNQAKRLTYQGK